MARQTNAKARQKARQHAKARQGTPKGWRATFSSEMLKHAKSTPARQKNASTPKL